MRPITLLFAACLICLSTSVFGQLTTSFSLDPSTQPLFPIGSKVSVQVKAVSGFNGLVSFQFPIGFNKDVLRFDSLNSYDGLPGFTAGSFNPQQALGKISVSWSNEFTINPAGLTLSGNSLMFIIHFTVLSVGSTNLNLLPNAQPLILAENLAGTSVGVIYQNTGLGITTGDGTVTYTGFKVIANTLYIPQGMRGCMPVTVNDFDNILSLQYAMHWDPAVLQFDCIRNIALPDLASNMSNPNNSTHSVAWFDNALVGITRADGSRIYDICFTAIGQPGQPSAITIDGVGVSGGVEAINATNANVWTGPAHPNGATPVGSTINIITTPPPPDAVTIMVDTITAVGTINNTCVPVKVKNFNNVTTAEFTLAYDNTQLTLVTPITAGGPLSLSASNFNTAAAGQVRFTWSNAAGITVANNTAIFSVCFNSSATTGTFPLELKSATGTNVCGNPWSAIGVARKNVGGVPIKLENGFVKLPSGASVSIMKTNLNCANVNNGTAQVKMSDNSTPITIKWAGPSINAGNMGSANLTNLAAGPYTVTVTLAGGATQTASTTITAPPAFTFQSNFTPNNCFGGSTASITTTAGGGTGALTYSWAGPAPFPGATTANISNLKAGLYTVTVRDANQCSSTYTVTVTDPTAVTLSTTSINVTNVACFGINNGSISIAASGGMAPYTYLWNNGSTGATISNLGPGSFVPVITDSKGCSYTAQAIGVTGPTGPVVVTFVSKKDVKCKDGNDGGITIAVNGGTPSVAPAAPYTFSWKNASQINVSAQQNPSNLPAGTYTVLVTDSRGCTAVLSAPVVIAEPTTALAGGPATVTNVQCFGSNTGSISLNLSGGWGNNVVTWSSGLPGGTNPVSVPQGIHVATITDLNGEGCTINQTVTVTGPANDISMGTPSVTGVACFGAGTGGIVISPSGGNGGTFTATWSYPGGPILSGVAIGQLEGGNYTVTVEDVLGCTRVFPPVTVEEPNEPVAIISNVVTNQNGSQLGSINIEVNGGTPSTNGYTYNWAPPIVAQTQDLNNLPAGTYVVTVTDANGCSLIQDFTVAQDNDIADTEVTSVQNACGADGCINISIAESASKPYNIKWTGPTPGEIVASFDNAVSICNLLAGNNYSITVTSSIGNTIVLPAMVNQNASPNFTGQSMPSFEGTASGSATVIPESGSILSYAWDQGATTASIQNLLPGTYTVTVTNTVNGCTATQTFTILAQYLPLVAELAATGGVIQPKCKNDTDGAINIVVTNGKKPYTYAWSNASTTEDISGLPAGVYTVTVTDALGETKVIPVTLANQSNLEITNVNELSFTPGGYQVTGEGICDGKALVVFTGQSGIANILWSNGASTPQTNTLCGGAYSVTVTDQIGCTSVWADSLTSPVGIVIASSIVSGVRCKDDCNAIAAVSVNGGVQPYSVKWSTGQIDQQIFEDEESRAIGLCPGVYTVTITDDNGVTRIVNDITVVNPPAITIALSSPIEPTTFTSCDGQVMAVLTGAVGIVRYEWTSNRVGKFGESQLADNLCPGEIIRFDVEDANGCKAFAYDTVPTPPDGCNIGRPVITPNDDNLNDFFIITCANNTENTVEIFNRWGQLVFQVENYNDASPATRWNGTSKSNQPLPEGVYYYVYTYKDDSGTQVVEKGHINLLR